MTFFGALFIFLAFRAFKFIIRILFINVTPCVLQPVPVRETAKPAMIDLADLIC